MEFEIALAEDGCSFENVRSRTVTVQCRQPESLSSWIAPSWASSLRQRALAFEVSNEAEIGARAFISVRVNLLV